MSGIQTSRGQEKFIIPLAGTSQEESCDLLEYVTGQNVGGKSRAMDSVIYGLYALSTGNTVGAGSTQRKIIKTSHGARKNDVVVFTSGANAGIPVQILSCPDANTIIIAANPEQTTATGDTFDIKRYVTPLYASDGSISVTIPAGSATAANQVLEIAQLTAGSASLSSIDGKLSSQATASKQDLLLAELQLKADLTETQPVSIAGTVAVSGPLTDAQLRATPVPVSGTVSTGGLTDAELRATPVPVSGTVTANLGTVAGLALDTNIDALRVLTGAVTETAPATDTASSGLNGRLQRIAQRITSLIALVPTSLGQKTMTNSFAVTMASDQTAIPVSGTVAVTQGYVSGTLKSAQITVGLTQVRATTDASAPSATRGKLMIKPSKNNSGAIFLIPTGGTISTGMEIIGPDRLEFVFDPTDYYLISDTAAQTVEIIEVE